MRFSTYSITLLAVLAGCFFSCSNKEVITQDIIIAVDITDTFFHHPSMAVLKSLSAVAKNPRNGEHLTIFSITETSYGEMYEDSIAPVYNDLQGNDYERRDDTVAYFKRITTAADRIESGASSKEASVIFKPVSEALNKLAHSSADRRIMVLSTDGLENSSLANFYSPADFALLKNKPDSLIHRYLSAYPLEELSGITIHIINQPRNKEDGERFDVVAIFYKKLFTGVGATVNVIGSL